MKHLSILVLAAAALTVVPQFSFADNAPTKTTPVLGKDGKPMLGKDGKPIGVIKMTPEKKAAIMAKLGGMCVKPGTGQGKILILNEQKIVPLAQLTSPVDYLKKYTKLPIEIRDGEAKCAVPNRETVRALKANMLILVRENPADESPLLVSPDCAWAVVNVSALASDKPGAAKLAFRLRKEISRAFSFLCGGVNSMYQRTPANHAASLSALDYIDMDEVPADLISRFAPYVVGYGVTPYVISPYKAACKHGWAPAPTNDVQRKIWNDVHQLPASPIQIKYDPKRDGAKPPTAAPATK